MMVPEGIPLLLFVLLAGSSPSSIEELIIVPEKTKTTYEGSSVTIACDYKKTKDETYTLLWFKDPIYLNGMFTGTIVYSNTEERPQSPDYSSRVKYITDTTSQENQEGYWIKCALRITDLQKTDSGNYSFRLIGSKKYMSKALSLKVKDNPCKVHIEPSELKNPLNESEDFTVRCSTSGSCDGHPEWLVHSSEQNQEWTSSFSTDTIIETEEGKEGRKVTKLKLKATWKDNNRNLSCRPANSEDSWQIRNITLFVEHAPKETKATVSSEDVKEGDSVTLSCTSRGRPDVSFTWFKKQKTEKSQKMSDLELIDVKAEDSGEYYCEAKNKHGAEKSNIIVIDVKYGPKEVTVEPQGSIIDLKEGDKLTLKCSVKDSNPSAKQFTWYNNSQVLQQNSETLTIINVTADNTGSYHCMANNNIEAAESNAITVSVKYSPRNIKIDGTPSVKVGTPLTLTCSADADPLPLTYTWKHTPRLSSVPLSMKTAQLNIKNMTVQHAGQYSCDVTNTIGTRSHTINVDVLYAPNINIVHNMTTLTQWNWEFPVYLTCRADAFPPATDYEWYREENTTTVLSHHQNFTVQPQNPGMYYCTAANAIGKSRSENIMLFIGNNSLMVFYKIILPIILLLILIVIAIFLIHRTIIKARSDQQSGADNPLCFFPVFLSRSSTLTNLLLLRSHNNTQEDLSVEGIPDPGYGRVNQSRPTPSSQDPTRAQDLNPRPKSDIHTVYSAIKLPQMKQARPPTQQKTGYMDNGAATSTLNYVTFDFKGQNKPEKRVPEGSSVYAMVSKNKQTTNSQSENPDYENVSSACVPKLPFTNMDWDSDTSEEDEVNYSSVSCAAKPAVKDPKHNQKSRFSSSSSDDEDRTEYSAVKT